MPRRYEHYTSGDTDQEAVCGDYWLFQTFTPQKTHKLSLLRLLLNNGGGGICITEGTPIHTPQGMILVEDLRKGSPVYCFDFKGNNIKVSKVLSSRQYRADSFLRIHTASGFVQATKEHPFYVEGTGWRKAGNLSKGDCLQTSTGNEQIIDIKVVTKPTLVYDPQIKLYHNYFAGSNYALAHNKSDVTVSVRAFDPDLGPTGPDLTSTTFQAEEITAKGYIAEGVIYGMADMGGGIEIMGDSTGNVYCSADSGQNWESLGVIAGPVDCMAPLTQGKAILGDDNGNVVIFFLNPGGELDWTIPIVVSSSGIYTIKYLEDDVVIAAGYDGHVYRSPDVGATWSDVGQISSVPIYASEYLGKSVVVVGDEDGNVFRSQNLGLNWTNLGCIGVGLISAISNFGDGISVMVDYAGNIYRSTDYGAIWTYVTTVGWGGHGIMANSGDGVAIIGCEDKHIYRCPDYGLTWVDRGVSASGYIGAIVSLSKGIAILGDSGGLVYRSTDSGQNWLDMASQLKEIKMPPCRVIKGNEYAIILRGLRGPEVE